MGKIVVAALVAIWLFNMARFAMLGFPGHVHSQAPVPVPTRSAVAHGQPLAAPASAEEDLTILNASASTGANTTVSVALTLPSAGWVDVQLFDPSGRHVISRRTRRLPAGQRSVQLQTIERLQAGSYWVRAQMGDEVATKPVAVNW
jgi:hypothetical protein